VVFLFSVVWHWNDFFEPFIYLNRMEHFTLPMRLSVLSPTLNQVTGGQAGDLFNEALVMAAIFLVILPPWPSTCSPSASSSSPSTAPAWWSSAGRSG
jgi:ABC-type glycerol-3-phosphate transport system permease component